MSHNVLFEWLSKKYQKEKREDDFSEVKWKSCAAPEFLLVISLNDGDAHTLMKDYFIHVCVSFGLNSEKELFVKKEKAARTYRKLLH